MIVKRVCEVCGLTDANILQRHHIIPQCDPRCTNGDGNIAVLCPNDHMRVHTGEIVILGVYPSTSGRCLVWHLRGEPPPFAREFWIVKDNPLVVTIAGDKDDLQDGE